MKLNSFALQHEVTLFLVLTFLLSLLAFIGMYLNPKLQSPESMQALPVWLVAVWSPTVSALLVWWMQSRLFEKFLQLFALPPLSIWLIVLVIPLIVMGAVYLFHAPMTSEGTMASELSFKMVMIMIAFNLFLGPLGEEMGWRGLLFENYLHFGWMAAALLIGAIWFIWHLPLWLIDSPQAEIDVAIFFVHVLCYSILMAILTLHANGSIWPAIFFHLLVNVITAVLLYITALGVNEIYKLTACYYLPITLVVIGLHELLAKKGCAISS